MCSCWVWKTPIYQVRNVKRWCQCTASKGIRQVPVTHIAEPGDTIKYLMTTLVNFIRWTTYFIQKYKNCLMSYCLKPVVMEIG